LSSWIIRLAYLHGIKVETFVTLIFGYRKPIWNRDIDRAASTDVLQRLAEVTGTPFEQVKEIPLKHFEGIIFEKFNTNAFVPWLLPVGIYHRKRRRNGLQYCPLCLGSDPIPYYRRRWRLGFVTTCIKHKVVLLDRCGNCGAVVAPFRYDMQSRGIFPVPKDIVRCFNCFESLSTSIPEKATEEIVDFQSKWEKAIQFGWIEWANNPSMYSHIFFEGLRALCTGLMRKPNFSRLTGGGDFSFLKKDFYKQGIEFMPTLGRYNLLNVAQPFLTDWPSSFAGMAKEYNLLYSYFKGEGSILPYWYEEAIKWGIARIPAKLSAQEACSIKSVIEYKYGKFSNYICRKEFGIDLSYYIDRQITGIDDELAELFLASLDHEISGTLDKATRRVLLRDKIMFGVARGLSLTISAISALSISDVRSVALTNAIEASFFESPKSAKEAYAWAKWYSDYFEDEIDSENDILFTSFLTKRKLSSSSISARFIRAMQFSALTSCIKNFKNFCYRG
jgi:hypothetical protein